MFDVYVELEAGVYTQGEINCVLIMEKRRWKASEESKKIKENAILTRVC